MMKQHILKSVSLVALITSCAGFSAAPLSTGLKHSMNLDRVPLTTSKTSFPVQINRATTTSVYASNIDTEEESEGGFLSDFDDRDCLGSQI